MRAAILFLFIHFAGAEEEVSPIAPQEMDGKNGVVQYSFSPAKRTQTREVAGIAALVKSNSNKSISRTAARGPAVGQREISRSKR